MTGLILTSILGATNAYAHDATGDASCGTLTLGGLDSTTAHTLSINPPAPAVNDDVTATAERTAGSTVTVFRVVIAWFLNNVQQQSDETFPLSPPLPYSVPSTLTGIAPGTWTICAIHFEDNIDRIHFDKIVFNVPGAVGGTLIPIDATSLLLAGTQMTASWMIPAIIAAIGIGIVIARKF